ncbi:hypothetical protein TNCV_835031 [Trichonephila clavipes]|nr:hypothetical protein TNCV_835031 [Trichonephila clavipes]
MYSVFATWGTVNNHRAASPLVRLVEAEERSLTTSRVFSLKIGVKPSQIVLSPVWCSKLRLTTGVHIAFCRDDFVGPRSDNLR